MRVCVPGMRWRTSPHPGPLPEGEGVNAKCRHSCMLQRPCAARAHCIRSLSRLRERAGVRVGGARIALTPTLSHKWERGQCPRFLATNRRRQAAHRSLPQAGEGGMRVASLRPVCCSLSPAPGERVGVRGCRHAALPQQRKRPPGCPGGPGSACSFSAAPVQRGRAPGLLKVLPAGLNAGRPLGRGPKDLPAGRWPIGAAGFGSTRLGSRPTMVVGAMRCVV